MVVQVYTNEKPAVPHRAMVGSILLLITACGLALALQRARNEATLDDPFHPAEWTVSFRPPHHFAKIQQGVSNLGPTYVFGGQTRAGDEALLFAFHISSVEYRDAEAVCRALLESPLWPAPHLLRTAVPAAESCSMGDLHTAAEIVDRDQAAVVRVAFFSKGEGYGFALHVPSGTVDRFSLDLFDQICDSVRITGGARLENAPPSRDALLPQSDLVSH